MDFGHLFFSADGRIGQRDFWLGAILLFIFGIVIHAVVVIGTILWFLSAYCWICLYSKRLHDIGRSGWLQIFPWVIGFLLLAVGGVLGVGGALGAIFTGMPHFVAAGLFGWVTAMLGIFLMSWIVHFLFMLWIGLTPGQRGPNRYGPEPFSRSAAYQPR